MTEDDPPGADEAAWTAADIDRFAGLGPEWFWEDELHLPRAVGWAEQNAAEVARVRRETRWSCNKLAKHFGKSKDTIRRALRHAEWQAPDAAPAGDDADGCG